jgi:hypothetical protein
MSCRTGALRGQRSLRDLYTGFAASSRWSAQTFVRDHREPHPKGYTHHEVIAPRAVGPRGSASLLDASRAGPRRGLGTGFRQR